MRTHMTSQALLPLFVCLFVFVLNFGFVTLRLRIVMLSSSQSYSSYDVKSD